MAALQQPGLPGPEAMSTMVRDRELARKFPDLHMQLRDPSPGRIVHDRRAADSRCRFPPGEIAGQLFADAALPPPGMAENHHHVASTLATAYRSSETFRRLFNHAWDSDLRCPTRRWALGLRADDPGVAGHRQAIVLNRTRLEAASYPSVSGEQPLGWTRGCLQEIISGLLGTPDTIDARHPRGAAVEYTNIVLKELGCSSPARQLSADADTSASSMPAGRLASALQLGQRYMDRGRQPDTAVTLSDMVSMREVARCENDRKTGLNLALAGSMDEVASLLADKAPPFHLRLVFREPRHGYHHAFADIDAQPGQPLSAILIETAAAASAHPLYQRFSQALGRFADRHDGMLLAVIDSHVQRSRGDCLIFCMSFALKSYKHAASFTRLHHDHRSGQLACARVQDDIFSGMGILLLPCALLPADFIKHTHSAQLIRERLLAGNDDQDARALLRLKMASIEAGRRPELAEASSGNRPSIEYKRLSLIRRAMAAVSRPDGGPAGS